MIEADYLKMPGMTYSEAGARIGGHKHNWVAREVKSGRLKARNYGYRTKRILEIDLLEYIANCATKTKPTRNGK